MKGYLKNKKWGEYIMGKNKEIRKIQKELMWLQAKKRSIDTDRYMTGYLFESATAKLNSEEVNSMSAVDYVRYKAQAKNSRARLMELDDISNSLADGIYAAVTQLTALGAEPVRRKRISEIMMEKEQEKVMEI